MMNAARKSGTWLVRVMDSRITTRVVQVIAILSLMLSFTVAAKQYQLTTCLARYNDQAAKATGQRIDAAEEDRKALDLMVDAVVNAKERGAAGQALLTYVNTRKQSDAKRSRNPQPAPPSELCR